MRLVCPIVLCAAFAAGFSGCTSLLTARALDTFAESLDQEDLTAVKSLASADFQQKVLRRSEALIDLEILDLPSGRIRVVEDEKVSDVERRVTVEIDASGEELQYKLVRSPDDRRWLVDDIYVQRQSTNGEKTIVQSVAQQMDLLLTIRDYLDAWATGGRDDVLTFTTEPFSELLAELSPAHLNQLTSEFIGESTHSFRPHAKINKDGQALVRLPRSTGRLAISLELQDGRWLVDDVAIETGREQGVRSARDTALVLRSTARFLNAWRAHDKPAIRSSSTDALFRTALEHSDLKTVPLPAIALLGATYELDQHEDSADITFSTDSDSYVFQLLDPSGDDPTGSPDFRVADVTIYQHGGEQVMKISAMFTAHAMVDVFSDALASRDLAQLRQLSTLDFAKRVWSQTSDEVMDALPLENIRPVRPKVISTVFQGPVTEVTATQGPLALTYVLRQERGRFYVDDVLLPVIGRPNSLKANFELLVPVYSFALGIRRHDMPLLRLVSSRELSRLTWEQQSQVPDLGYDLDRHLTAPLSSLIVDRGQATVTLGDEDFGAVVTLVQAGTRYVIDDIQMISVQHPERSVSFRESARLQRMRGTGSQLTRGVSTGAVPPTF